MDNKLLEIKGLKVKAGDKEILNGLNLEVGKGEVHVIMGPNGAGKSTLANALMGHPKYVVSEGEIFFEGELINNLKVDERARKGIFLSFQNPEEIPGITVRNFLSTAKSAVTGKRTGVLAFRDELKEKMQSLQMDPGYAERYLNAGFSGGEKKKNEMLQMAVLQPKLAILDETDSGLDVDATRIVSQGVANFANENNSIIIITHQNRIFDYIKPDFVHVLIDGKIVKTGNMSLAEEINEKGFSEFRPAV